MTGWVYIILCAVISVLIAHFLKVSETRKYNTVRILTINYLVATTVAFGTSGFIKFDGIEAGELTLAILLGIVVGVIFIANFFIYSKSVHHNGVGVSVAAMRISLIVPVILSTFWYLELLSPLQWIGVIFVFGALFLLLPNKRQMIKEPFSAAWLLVLLFFGTGVGDASLKVYEAEFSSLITKEQFMGIVFFSAFIVGCCVIFFRKNWQFSRGEILLGVAIGVPNLYTSIFLIEALERLSGGIVYSSVNVLTVLLGTLLGLLRWGDRLTKLQWMGIILTFVSILLLI